MDCRVKCGNDQSKPSGSNQNNNRQERKMTNNRNTGIKTPADNTTESAPRDTPEGKVEFKYKLLRMIANLKENWRTCRAPKCRRGRSCTSAQLFCLRKARPPVTDEEWAPVAAELQRALKQRLNELGR
jgi:hypothetical protein